MPGYLFTIKDDLGQADRECENGYCGCYDNYDYSRRSYHYDRAMGIIGGCLADHWSVFESYFYPCGESLAPESGSFCMQHLKERRAQANS